MKAAISNMGESFFTINHGKTNSLTFLHFIIKLMNQLSDIDNEWRNNTIFLIDNAPYHRGKMIIEAFKKLKVPVMFLGPYQYKLAPVELYFAYIKKKDLDPTNQKTQNRVSINTYMKEICSHISKLNTEWIPKSFYHLLTPALEALSMKNL